MPWVGSWPSQNFCSTWAVEITDGSYATRTASVWPVRPLQTSREVGFGGDPPAEPTDVVQTPGVSQKTRSAPQKQPMPTSSQSMPSGNGGTRGLPASTSCSAGMSKDG